MDRNLHPDKTLLSRIFPDAEPASTTILSQTHQVCTFIAHADVSRDTGPAYPENVVVRLELPSMIPLRTVMAIQRVAELAIPEVVPAIYQNGTVLAEDGREIEFCVSEFVPDAVTLDTVWDDLTEKQQSDIMDAVLDAMTKLQSLDLADESVHEILDTCGSGVSFKTTRREGGAVWPSDSAYLALGNREIGFYKNVADLLMGIIVYNGMSEHLTLNPGGSGRGNGIVMALTGEENPVFPVRIRAQELESLQRQAVLCHNDLEPRNILVRPVDVTVDDNGSPSIQRYELAAIIDWEMAGFLPFAYEYVAKDAFLGCKNLSFSWYTLFKSRTAPLFPGEVGQSSLLLSQRSQTLFMEAMDWIQRSKVPNRRDVGALFRERWIQREQLVPGHWSGSGWVRRSDARDVRVYRKEDDEALEREVSNELGLL